MNRIIRNFLSVSFSNLIGQLLTFLIVAYYARLLGETNFGIITLAQQITLYFTMITLFGMQTYGTKLISSGKDLINNVTGEILMLRLSVFVMCYFVLAIVAIFVNKGEIFKILLLLFGLTLLPISLNIDWVFNGLQEMQHNAVYNLFKNIIPCILIFFFLKTSKGIYLIPIFTVVGLIFGVIYQYYIFLRKDKYKLNIRFSVRIMIKYCKLGYPFLISGILGMVNNNVDKIIMGFTRTMAELGVYQSAYTIISFLVNIIALIFTPVFPLLISYFHENKKNELQKLSNNIGKIVMLVAVPIFIGGTLLSKDIIMLFYKSKYIAAYLPLNILLIYILILFIREIYGYQLNAWGLEKSYLKIVGVSALANFCLNIVVIPRYGMIGAACVTTITELINLIYMKKVASTVIKTEMFIFGLKVLVPSSLMALSIFSLRSLGVGLIINIVSAIFIYFISVILFNIINKKEIMGFLFKGERG